MCSHWDYSRAQTALIYRLSRWIDDGVERGYASTPADVPIDDLNVFAPDVWWVGEGRRPVAGQRDLVELPDLVVEIRSPSTWARDVGAKLPAYEAAGVAEAWYIDTEARTMLVFRRAIATSPTFDVTVELQADEDLTSPMLPGFALPVGSIFDP